ncbi:MAG: tRNA threonylcarbamoyladenosine dehydratase [Candidatus Hydrogenedentes bacterium]|nr:tRNA threonylcarbamoyladenosine dehydratase [Candidatus Hydrogenedentota bacterium]
MAESNEAWDSRTELLVGAEGMARLRAAHVAVFGLGGVGSYALEALARAGVGHLTVADFDQVSLSNVNRQTLALRSTVGCLKTELAAARIRDISPGAVVHVVADFVDEGNIESALDGGAGYVIDAIDTVRAKVALLAAAHRRGLYAVSCMGAANKLDPRGICVSDIRATTCCPLAKAVRLRLRRAGIAGGISCVYSEENRKTWRKTGEPDARRKRWVQGSISYVPGIIGLTAAGLIVQTILGELLPV